MSKLKLLGILGSIASLIGLALVFIPATPKEKTSNITKHNETSVVGNNNVVNNGIMTNEQTNNFPSSEGGANKQR